VKPIREWWAGDFEFQPAIDLANEHNPVRPVCFAATELLSGRTVRLWQDELTPGRPLPINTGEDAVFVCYSAGAEGSCFEALNLKPPHNVLDIYAERVLRLNCDDSGKSRKGNTSLIRTLAHYGLPALSAEHKDLFRQKILTQTAWSPEEQTESLDYCVSDGASLRDLWRAMEREQAIDLPQALWRGRAMFVSGMAEQTGIPIDVKTYHRLREQRGNLRRILIEQGDEFGVFEDSVFRKQRVYDLIKRLRIPWDRYTEKTGKLRLDEETFKIMARLHPAIGRLRSFTSLLDQLRSFDLALGDDARNRFWSRPLLSITSRSQPSTAENIFALPKWMRGLVTPPEDRAIVQLDYAGQETAIGAGQSDDPALRQLYLAGDIHLAMAIATGLVPAHASKESHPTGRDQAKPLTHGSAYGITARGIQDKLGISLREARWMIESYDRTFHIFREWQIGIVDRALLTGRITSPFGWSMKLAERTSPGTLLNWMLQTLGAEMTRTACVMLVRAGFKICATSHDSVVLLVPLDRLAERVTEARQIMERVSLSFTRGLKVRTDADVILPGQRLLNRDTRPVWNRMMEAIGVVEALDQPPSLRSVTCPPVSTHLPIGEHLPAHR
jgi:hypothetical protein